MNTSKTQKDPVADAPSTVVLDGFLNVTKSEFAELKTIFTHIPGNENVDAVKALRYLNLDPEKTAFKNFEVRIVNSVDLRISAV